MLELVEGPTLADRIRQGPIPIDEALPIAKQIAEALEAAHEAGVIHRDLKPANIKVKDDGTVKVLDFGLAKALDPTPQGDPSLSPTLTAAATQMGVIMGTAAYMSPEQARGKPVDKRADVWAFGAVVFEMLTGQKAFPGDDLTDTIAAVVRGEPAWEALPKDVPPRFTQVLRACLQKELRQRIRDIGDVMLAVEGVFESQAVSTPNAGGVNDQRLWQRPVPAAAVLLLVAGISALATWTLSSGDAIRAPVQRLSISLPLEHQLVTAGWPRATVALSPDGARLVYVGRPDTSSVLRALFLRPLGTLETRRIVGTADGGQPFFSPDGRFVAFFNRQALMKVALEGGDPVPLLEGLGDGFWTFGTWTTDDTIIIGRPSGGLRRVPANGGVAESITSLDADTAERAHRTPEVLPGGKDVLFSVEDDALRSRIEVVDLDTGDRRTLVEDGRRPLYASSGHLLFVRDRVLMAAPFDADRAVLTGPEVPLPERVQVDDWGIPQMDLSSTGTLAYVPVGQANAGTLMWVTRAGLVETLDAPMFTYAHPRVSPRPYRRCDCNI